MIKILVTISSGVPVPSAWDQTADVFVVLNHTFTFVLLYHYDTTVYNDVNQLLKKWNLWHQKQIEID